MQLGSHGSVQRTMSRCILHASCCTATGKLWAYGCNVHSHGHRCYCLLRWNAQALCDKRFAHCTSVPVMPNCITFVCALFGYFLVHFCSCVVGEDSQAEISALQADLPIQECTKADPGARRHVEWINKVDGRRIAFVGDSPLRCEVSVMPVHSHAPRRRRLG